MVRFHVLHHEIGGSAAFEGFFQVGKPFLAFAEVNGIHDGNLLVHNQVRVVRDAVRDDVLAFEQVDVGVIYTDVFDFFCYVGCHIVWFLINTLQKIVA